MARKPRDHKAETARRNALAIERGFTSRAAQRRAIEKGAAPAIDARRLRSPRTIQAQRSNLYDSFLQRTSIRERNQDWSIFGSRHGSSAYSPERAKSLGLTRAQYDQAYYDAWIAPSSGYKAVRDSGGSDALRLWLTELSDEPMEAADYDGRY